MRFEEIGKIMYWIRLGEEIYGNKDNIVPINLSQVKKLLLEELKMEENPQQLDDLLEGLQKANLITINGNTVNTVTRR